jgi:Flp pilus assembly protein TadB
LKALEENIKKEYPHVYVDSVLFGAAILLVVVAAVFSIVSRAVGISLWYPLLILVVPAGIGLYITRRRNTYYKRLEKVRLMIARVD